MDPQMEMLCGSVMKLKVEDNNDNHDTPRSLPELEQFDENASSNIGSLQSNAESGGSDKESGSKSSMSTRDVDIKLRKGEQEKPPHLRKENEAMSKLPKEQTPTAFATTYRLAAKQKAKAFKQD
uniref:Uncharacterized protein n=1 Tax=Chenopodium quinoa TaxID=63459 RepID=A0A803MAY2_CHEQI